MPRVRRRSSLASLEAGTEEAARREGAAAAAAAAAAAEEEEDHPAGPGPEAGSCEGSEEEEAALGDAAAMGAAAAALAPAGDEGGGGGGDAAAKARLTSATSLASRPGAYAVGGTSLAAVDGPASPFLEKDETVAILEATLALEEGGIGFGGGGAGGNGGGVGGMDMDMNMAGVVYPAGEEDEARQRQLRRDRSVRALGCAAVTVILGLAFGLGMALGRPWHQGSAGIAALPPAPPPSPASPLSGVDLCERRGYGKERCQEVGCCSWDGTECHSALGSGPCLDPLDPPPDPSGEEACEGRGFGRSECLEVGCCQWDREEGRCYSDVDREPCGGGGGGGIDPAPPPRRRGDRTDRGGCLRAEGLRSQLVPLDRVLPLGVRGVPLGRSGRSVLFQRGGGRRREGRRRYHL